ncbi:hypothetical protein BJV74DRAFT_798124 [Russula compacta]|nr:hypothetical protein BJV74DRAFT_798124 [Russula compacta]
MFRVVIRMGNGTGVLPGLKAPGLAGSWEEGSRLAWVGGRRSEIPSLARVQATAKGSNWPKISPLASSKGAARHSGHGPKLRKSNWWDAQVASSRHHGPCTRRYNVETQGQTDGLEQNCESSPRHLAYALICLTMSDGQDLSTNFSFRPFDSHFSQPGHLGTMGPMSGDATQAIQQYMCHNVPVSAFVAPCKQRRPRDSARARGRMQPMGACAPPSGLRSSFVSLEKEFVQLSAIHARGDLAQEEWCLLEDDVNGSVVMAQRYVDVHIVPYTSHYVDPFVHSLTSQFGPVNHRAARARHLKCTVLSLGDPPS